MESNRVKDSMIDNLRKFYLQGELADVVLEAEGVTIACHRVVLAAASPYFHAMFADNGFAESGSQTVPLEGISAAALKLIVDFIYGIRHLDEGEEPMTLLEQVLAANMLQVHSVIVETLQHLTAGIDEHLREPRFLITLFDVLSTLDVESLGIHQLAHPRTLLRHIGSKFQEIVDKEMLEQVSLCSIRNILSYPNLSCDEDSVSTGLMSWLQHRKFKEIAEEDVSTLLNLLVISELSEENFQKLLEVDALTDALRQSLRTRRESREISRHTVAKRLIMTRFSEQKDQFCLSRVDTECMEAIEEDPMTENCPLSPPPLPTDVTNGRMLSSWQRHNDGSIRNRLYYVAVVGERVVHVFLHGVQGWEDIGSMTESCSAESVSEEHTEHRLKIFSVCAYKMKLYILLELRDSVSGSKVAAKLVTAEAVDHSESWMQRLASFSVVWKDHGHLFSHDYGRMGMSRVRRCLFYNPVMTAAEENHLFVFDVGDNYHLQIPTEEEESASSPSRRLSRLPMLVLVPLETTRPIALSEDVPLTSAALGPAVVLSNKRRLLSDGSLPTLALFLPCQRMTSGVWHTIELTDIITREEALSSQFRVVLLNDASSLLVAVLIQESDSCRCTLGAIREQSTDGKSAYNIVPLWTRALDVGFGDLEFVNAYAANLNLWQLGKSNTDF